MPIILCGHASSVLTAVFVSVVLLLVVVVVMVVVVVVVVVIVVVVVVVEVVVVVFVCNIIIIHGHCGIYFYMPISSRFNLLWQLNKIFP